MWRGAGSADPVFTSALELDLSTVEPSLAGPRRPQDRVPLARAAEGFADALADMRNMTPGGQAANMVSEGGGAVEPLEKSGAVEGESYRVADGHVVIAAITSCTNTSNPNVLMAAGLLARKAAEKGLKPKPWVKTSLAPGSQVVTDYLAKSGLQSDLDALGFNLAGDGCTTCIGNSGPLPEPISKAIQENDLDRGGRSLRQPQFRGPHQSGRPRELSSLAAAGGRLRAGGHDEAEPHGRTDWHG